VNNFKSDQTSEPVQWLRIPSAIRRFGLSRAKLYELISANEIKSVCVRKRGSIKGCRLISAESLESYIESFFEESVRNGGLKK
jgi:Helix-turn-helix domain